MPGRHKQKIKGIKGARHKKFIMKFYDDKNSILNIVLVEPEIPPNTGNIARLCVATNSRLIIAGEPSFSLENKYLKRAGLDYWEYLNFLKIDSVYEIFEKIEPERIFLFSTKVKKSYTMGDYKFGSYLIFGKESRGLDEALLVKYFENCYTIPMWGKVRSLNLSSAVSIVTYEALKKLKKF